MSECRLQASSPWTGPPSAPTRAAQWWPKRRVPGPWVVDCLPFPLNNAGRSWSAVSHRTLPTHPRYLNAGVRSLTMTSTGEDHQPPLPPAGAVEGQPTAHALMAPLPSSSSAPVISQLLGRLKPPLILTDTAWIPKFRQTCFPPDSISQQHTQDTAHTQPQTAELASSTAPQPTSWQHHLSSAPKESFTSSFAHILSSRPSLVFFGEQHHQPHVIRAQIQLLAALADQRDELDKELLDSPRPGKRTVHHLHLLMEHFSYADQPLLDRFHAGTLSISELCSAYRERSNEGFKIEMYAPLLVLAREKGATIWGGFPPRTWAREMVKEGVEKVKGLEEQRRSDTQADPTRKPPVSARIEEEVTMEEKTSAGTSGPPQPGPLPFLPGPGRLSLPPFISWDRVQQLSASHRTFLSSLMRPDGPPRFPSTPSPSVPLGAISALRLYPTQDLQGPKAESKGFSSAQALKDSYLAHAASSLVEEGHLLARTTSESTRGQSPSASTEDTEVEHRNIVLVVAGLGHVEAGFGAPERLAQSVPGPDTPADSRGRQRPLIILSKPKDSSLWLGPEWGGPTSSQSSAPSACETQTITPEWLKQQVLAPSAGQVAGHAGAVGTFEGPNREALVAKTSINSEAHFYEELNSSQLLAHESRGAAARRKTFAQSFTPKYYGSFSLSDDPASKEVSIVCEDLLAGYRRPNVMDIKLGTQLWDEDSSEEKRQRMEKVSRETTSGPTGIRLTGWRVSRLVRMSVSGRVMTDDCPIVAHRRGTRSSKITTSSPKSSASRSSPTSSHWACEPFSVSCTPVAARRRQLQQWEPVHKTKPRPLSRS